jgi:hypothetical protein
VVSYTPDETAAAPGHDTTAYAQQPQAGYDPAAYVQQPQAGYDPAAYAQQPQAGYDPAAYAQQPPKKKKTGLIIAIVVIVLLVLCGCVIGGLAAFTPIFSTITEVIEEPGEPITQPESPDPGTDPGSDPGTGAQSGYATADEAVQAMLDEEGYGDWVFSVYDESGGMIVYWSGPPASEYVIEVTVTQEDDGSWVVADVAGLDFGGDVPEGGMSPYDQAIDVVGNHLYAVKQDRGLDAQSYTVDPFRSDPASAQESAGALSSFEVLEASEQSDGSYWVRTVQNWTWGQEKWEYWVVPTELGYFIADMRPW